jgi:hypothetical protein
VVTGQMITGLIILGLAIKVIVGAVKARPGRQDALTPGPKPRRAPGTNGIPLSQPEKASGGGWPGLSTFRLAAGFAVAVLAL